MFQGESGCEGLLHRGLFSFLSKSTGALPSSAGYNGSSFVDLQLLAGGASAGANAGTGSPSVCEEKMACFLLVCWSPWVKMFTSPIRTTQTCSRTWRLRRFHVTFRKARPRKHPSPRPPPPPPIPSNQHPPTNVGAEVSLLGVVTVPCLERDAWPNDYGLTNKNLMKTDDRCFTQLAKMIIDPKLVELTADVVSILP